MGFGLPAAIGPKLPANNKTVVDVAMELATAAQYNIGVKAFVMNNELSFNGKALVIWFLILANPGV
jgi:thiamine pyrophosphate-dependent acetolactate synthase large subunit-like protein